MSGQGCRGKGVGAGDIPDKDSSTLPRHYSCPIRSLRVPFGKSGWLHLKEMDELGEKVVYA